VDLGWFEAAFNVTDIARSRAFYEALGIELAGGSGEGGVAALYKDDCLTLYQGHLDTHRPQLIFWQGDVEAIARELWDPDGNPRHFNTMKKYENNSHSTGPNGERIKVRQYPANKTRDVDFGWFEISLPVRDMRKSVGFYGALGFRIAEDHDPRNVTLVSRDCRLSLLPGRGSGSLLLQQLRVHDGHCRLKILEAVS
jgi:catechol 2,3-dioxygenase-like lactoylglutathione lyase family enzyme